MYYGKQLREIVDALRRLGSLPQDLCGISKKIDEHTEAISAADERKQQQEKIRQKWANEVLAEYKQSEGNKASNDNRNYGVQNSLRWAAWLAFLAAAIYAFVAARQLRTMNRTYGEIQKQTKAARQSTYMACLNAQAAQRTLIEVQRNAKDSHAGTAAVIEQASAGIESDEAFILPRFRMPQQEDEITMQLQIPYSYKNYGKMTAVNFGLWGRAVLLGKGDTIPLSDKILDPLIAVSKIRPGDEFPQKPEEPQYKPFTITLLVHDINGEVVSILSPAAQDFMYLHKFAIVIVFGKMQYTDLSGLHKNRFCVPLFLMNAGTTHQTTEIERSCAKYNRQEDTYSALPTIGKLMSPEEIKPVVCEVPKD